MRRYLPFERSYYYSMIASPHYYTADYVFAHLVWSSALLYCLLISLSLSKIYATKIPLARQIATTIRVMDFNLRCKLDQLFIQFVPLRLELYRQVDLNSFLLRVRLPSFGSFPLSGPAREFDSSSCYLCRTQVKFDIAEREVPFCAAD